MPRSTEALTACSCHRPGNKSLCAPTPAASPGGLSHRQRLAPRCRAAHAAPLRLPLSSCSGGPAGAELPHCRCCRRRGRSARRRPFPSLPPPPHMPRRAGAAASPGAAVTAAALSLPWVGGGRAALPGPARPGGNTAPAAGSPSAFSAAPRARCCCGAGGGHVAIVCAGALAPGVLHRPPRHPAPAAPPLPAALRPGLR